MQLNTEKPLIIAHRGASAAAPENTLAAFRQAIEDGAEGIEFDVQTARDGAPVVFHDFNLKRIIGREGRVADLTSAELQNLDAGTWFNRKNPLRANADFSAETIPTFAGLLDFLQNYEGLLYVELKFPKTEVAPLVKTICRMIRESVFTPQVRLKSFNLEALAHAKRIFPEIRTVALFQPKLPSLLRGKSYLIEQAAAAGADELSLHFSLATQKMMTLARAKNFPVTVWTIDRPAWVARARNLGIEAVITNDPARLLREKLKNGS